MEKRIFGLGEFKIKGVEEDGSFVATISGIKTDRYGDTINPEGWDIKNFKKNPVLLWAHDHKTPTVGRATKVWVDGKNLMMKGEFAPTPFAQELKLLAENGFLKAFSVGFKAVDYKFNENGIDFLKQELLEVSFVNVPAYADALMKTVDGDKEAYKNFRKETDKTLNWDGLIAKDSRDAILKENKNLKENKKEKTVTFTKSELEVFKKELELKAGKVLSKKNRDLVKEVLGSLEKVVTPLKDLLEATEEAKSEQEEEKPKKAVKKEFKLSETDLIRIANKSIEAVLVNRRKK